jgi:hypothetical protein
MKSTLPNIVSNPRASSFLAISEVLMPSVPKYIIKYVRHAMVLFCLADVYKSLQKQRLLPDN